MGIYVYIYTQYNYMIFMFDIKIEKRNITKI